VTTAFVTAVETALERELSSAVMSGNRKPVIRRLSTGERLVVQGERDHRIFVLLDGVIGVEVDGRELCEIGPGAVVGERSTLGDSTRTATLRAVTPCKVAVAAADDLDRDALERLSAGHRREETQ
jgi:CRP-like cAMP-binding protein